MVNKIDYSAGKEDVYVSSGSFDSSDDLLKDLNSINYDKENAVLTFEYPIEDEDLEDFSDFLNSSCMESCSRIWINPTHLSKEGWEEFKDYIVEYSDKFYFRDDSGNEVSEVMLDFQRVGGKDYDAA